MLVSSDLTNLVSVPGEPKGLLLALHLPNCIDFKHFLYGKTHHPISSPYIRLVYRVDIDLQPRRAYGSHGIVLGSVATSSKSVIQIFQRPHRTATE